MLLVRFNAVVMVMLVRASAARMEECNRDDAGERSGYLAKICEHLDLLTD
jgi:hypothetical protein